MIFFKNLSKKLISNVYRSKLQKRFDYLELSYEPVTTTMVRTSSGQMSDYIQNYDEVAAVIGQTDYAKFLTQP